MSTLDSKEDDSNRRSFYRLQDRVYIEFTRITSEHAEKMIASRQAMSPKSDEDSMYLESLNRQMGSIMPSIRSEHQGVAQYLEVLNKKVDFLAGMMFFERFKSHPTSPNSVRTNTVDISEGGLSFNSRKEYDMDIYFQMKIIIVNARVGIETVAKVVSSVAKQRKNLKFFRIGVQFPYLHEEDRRALSRYIMERQREQIRNLSEIDDWEEA